MQSTDKIVILAVGLTPYRNAELDAIAGVLGTDTVHAIFVVTNKDSSCFPDMFPQICLYSVLDNNQNVFRILENLQPTTVIVQGYTYTEAIKAMIWCKRRGIPYCLRSDSNIWKDRANQGWSHLVKKPFVNYWVRNAYTILICGTNNRDYWLRYGMKEHQNGWWPLWIDYTHFRKARLFRKQGPKFEALPGVTSQINLLYVGRLIPQKGVHKLCQALLQLDEQFRLTIVGSGVDENSLKKEFSERLGSRLYFAGAVTPDELPRYYAAADVFILPCGEMEPWGLVINEAMAAGLPIICGEKVGAAGDLVINWNNGILTKDIEVNDWVQAIRTLTKNPENMRKMGKESELIVDRWEAESRPDDCIGKLVRKLHQQTEKEL